MTRSIKLFQYGYKSREVVLSVQEIKMLLGTYRPNLIGRHRLALPTKLRKEIMGNRVVLAIGFEECILGFEEKKWEEATATDFSRPLSDSVGRELRRKMCSGAEVIELGVQGRFVIPEEMVRFAGIKDEIILVGAGDHFEIWSPERWQAYIAKINNRQYEKEVKGDSLERQLDEAAS